MSIKSATLHVYFGYEVNQTNEKMLKVVKLFSK
jgi:hypothetical protein